MAFKMPILAFLVIICSVNAKGVKSPISDSVAFGQCKDILSTIRTTALEKMENVAPEELPALICDVEDKDLQKQCTELLEDNGAELLNFIKTVDEGEMCEEICTEFGLVDSDDFSLYFQPGNSVTRTDEVGSFLCSICKRSMSFLHNFLTAKGHEAFVLHLLKGVCHFVPVFRTECDLLINMYGRLIINLAARYLSPKLCTTFHLCPRQLPSLLCDEPEDIQDGSKTYVNTATGSTVTYSCNEGFQMVQGEATRTCGQDGKWTGEVPICLKLVDMEILE